MRRARRSRDRSSIVISSDVLRSTNHEHAVERAERLLGLRRLPVQFGATCPHSGRPPRSTTRQNQPHPRVEVGHYGAIDAFSASRRRRRKCRSGDGATGANATRNGCSNASSLAARRTELNFHRTCRPSGLRAEADCTSTRPFVRGWPNDRFDICAKISGHDSP